MAFQACGRWERHNHPPLGKNQLNLLKNPHPLLSPVQQGARGLRLAEVMKPLLPCFSHFLDFGAEGFAKLVEGSLRFTRGLEHGISYA